MSALNQNIQRHPGVSATFLDNELVVMGSRDNIYYKINGCGIHIWNLTESKICSVQSIVDFIADHYGVEQSAVLPDVQSFILTLIEKEIFEYV